MINLIVGEYLRNLKERGELDCLFVLLLDQMGFKILKSARSSRGQSEYGNDISAVKIDEDRQKKIFIFQIKGGSDADISAHSFNKKNGIRDSLIQAIDVDFQDGSIPGLSDLPKKIVLVHNGELKANFRPQFDGFIDKQFNRNGIEFERWDIYRLTSYFSEYLLNEYLLARPEYINLFKKSLAFLDVPENDFNHFKELIDGLLRNLKGFWPKSFKRITATLSMISTMIYHYSQESDNLEPAKECLTYMLLKTWGWILEHKLENRRLVRTEFFKLNLIHFRMLDEYFSKTSADAKELDGLFSEWGGEFEIIGYPLRSMEYIGYLVYYLHSLRIISPIDLEIPEFDIKFEDLLSEGIGILKEIIENNSGCAKPLLDNHSIPVVLALLFLYENGEKEFAKDYLREVLENIALVKSFSKRLPELRNNIDELIVYAATNQRPSDYDDSSSYLIKTLFEFTVILEEKNLFDEFWEYITKDLHLLTCVAPEDIVGNEQLLFQKELEEEVATEIFEKKVFNHDRGAKGDSFENFIERVKSYTVEKIGYRTDKTGFKHLRILAHVYFKTPLFPDEWRYLL